MPVVFVHGVNVRTDASWSGIKTLLRRYVAPELSAEPESVPLHFAKWYEHAAKFYWDGASRPRSRLFGMGAHDEPADLEQASAAAEAGTLLDRIPAPSGASRDGGLIPAGPGSGAVSGDLRLRDLDPDALSGILIAAILGERSLPTGIAFNEADTETPTDEVTARAAIAADEVACDPSTKEALFGAQTHQEEADILQHLIEERFASLASADGLHAQGVVPTWLQSLGDRSREALERVGSAPGYALSIGLLEARGPLNDLITRFFGDVFTYLHQKDERERLIARTVLKVLRTAHEEAQTRQEPLVVLSHSMGGQIVYDLLTYDLRSDTTELRVDFWCAAASQVGLFEEMKLFRSSDRKYRKDNPVPFPPRSRLGGWWNVWDPNDVLSFTVNGIISEVDDEPFDGGCSVAGAHSGYLIRPSFYRQLASKLRSAKNANWYQP